MALHVPKAPGFQSMMKDGSRFFSGLEEAVIRNIGKKIQLSHPEHMFFIFTFIRFEVLKMTLILCERSELQLLN